ncbi:MAG: LiaF-related protein [Polyangia bacterium]
MLGGIELDFREASLGPGVTEVHITAVLGGVSLIVPPQLAVEMDGTAIMGGFEHSERAPVQLDPERPVLRVHGLALWGGVAIETRLPGETELEAHKRRHEQRRLPGKRAPALPPRRDE